MVRKGQKTAVRAREPWFRQCWIDLQNVSSIFPHVQMYSDRVAQDLGRLHFSSRRVVCRKISVHFENRASSRGFFFGESKNPQESMLHEPFCTTPDPLGGGGGCSRRETRFLRELAAPPASRQLFFTFAAHTASVCELVVHICT